MKTHADLPGLSQTEAEKRLRRFGPNLIFRATKKNPIAIAWEILTEPMVLLLMLACILYFVLGQWNEGWMLVAAILMVASISFYQTLKSNRAISDLGKLTQAHVKVNRDGNLVLIPVEEIVPGDCVFLEEGMSIPADGEVVICNDLTVNESQLTGESLPVARQITEKVFAGSQISTGSLYIQVTETAKETVLGKLGKSLNEIVPEKTFLQVQINRFVVGMTWIGAIAFFTILGLHYFKTHQFVAALLEGLTIAMAMIPEEIPVAFASFMALGAVHLASVNVLAREPQTVESLGSATVICTDKTGTLTTEGMQLAEMIGVRESVSFPTSETLPDSLRELLLYARLSSEPEPFDAMERAIDETFSKFYGDDWDYEIVKEYPLEGNPPMMTHVWTDAHGLQLVAAKGGLERILAICKPEGEQQRNIQMKCEALTAKGFRVLGVARANAMSSGAFPDSQDDFTWQYLGMIALFNPPKENAGSVVKGFYKAGIQVKMITGDYPLTASSIAAMVGIQDPSKVLTGEEIMKMPEAELKKQVGLVQVFARMFPDAKLRVVNALKSIGEVVAMTGDGVNDGPALKSAHIGIAMGKRGTEVARQAASLILVNDDLTGMLDAILLGRKFYQNLKKAVSYIVSIHIPIILSLALPLVFGWEVTGIFGPVHVIFLELVMGPTCSIAFENEPAEPGIMDQPPRRIRESFFSTQELLQNIVQGLAISASVLFVYFHEMDSGRSFSEIRTMVFLSLVLSNILLTLTNRSFVWSFVRTLFFPNRILWLMIALTLLVLSASLFLKPVQNLFQFSPISAGDMCFCLVVTIPGVFWIEILKFIRRQKREKNRR